MLAMNWVAELKFIAPLWLMQTGGLPGALQAGRPKDSLAGRFALASQVTLAIGSYTVCPPGFTCKPMPEAAGVPGILPWIIGSTKRKLNAIFEPCQPLLTDNVQQQLTSPVGCGRDVPDQYRSGWKLLNGPVVKPGTGTAVLGSLSPNAA